MDSCELEAAIPGEATRDGGDCFWDDPARFRRVRVRVGDAEPFRLLGGDLAPFAPDPGRDCGGDGGGRASRSWGGAGVADGGTARREIKYGYLFLNFAYIVVMKGDHVVAWCMRYAEPISCRQTGHR
jgi:hypothetical protein